MGVQYNQKRRDFYKIAILTLSKRKRFLSWIWEKYERLSLESVQRQKMPMKLLDEYIVYHFHIAGAWITLAKVRSQLSFCL